MKWESEQVRTTTNKQNEEKGAEESPMSMLQLMGDIMGLTNVQIVAGVLFLIVLYIIIRRRRSKASE